MMISTWSSVNARKPRSWSSRPPGVVIYVIAVCSVFESWCLAMVRDVERGLGMLDPMLHVLLGGFQLPVLATLSRMPAPFGAFLPRGGSPLPLFALTGAILYAVWARRLLGPALPPALFSDTRVGKPYLTHE
jgi:hypothetical protein